jgi:hypothetical protein
MTGMTTFNEFDHPRAQSGQFAEKRQSGDTITLASPDDAIIEALKTPASIDAIGEKVSKLTPKQVDALALIKEYREPEPHEAAWRAIRIIESHEVQQMQRPGVMHNAESANPNRQAAEAMYDFAFFQQGPHRTEAHDDALELARDAAVAVTYRWKIGRPEYPGWTQQAYEQLTEPWARVMGKAHPDD